MTMRRVALLALAAEAVATALAWPRLPDRIALHWDLHGQPNGYGSRLELLLAGPALLAFIWGLLELLPRLDPRMSRPADPEQTEAERRGALDIVAGAVLLLLAAIYATILLHALGILKDATRVNVVLVAGFLVAFGNFAGRLRPSWFIGIRTPWTLSSDDVWRRTHRLAGRLMVPAGLLLLVAAVAAPPGTLVFALLAAVGLSVVPPLVMSYLWWRRSAV